MDKHIQDLEARVLQVEEQLNALESRLRRAGALLESVRIEYEASGVSH